MVARVTRLVAEKFVLSSFPRPLITLSSMCSRAVRACKFSHGLINDDRQAHYRYSSLIAIFECQVCAKSGIARSCRSSPCRAQRGKKRARKARAIAGSPEVEGECASGALWDPNRARRWRACSCLGPVRDAWSGPAPGDAGRRRKSLSVANLTGAPPRPLASQHSSPVCSPLTRRRRGSSGS